MINERKHVSCQQESVDRIHFVEMNPAIVEIVGVNSHHCTGTITAWGMKRVGKRLNQRSHIP